jgi:hypothetical protein
MSETFQVQCPDCGSVLTIDPATRAVLRHEPAASGQKLGSLEDAAREVVRRRERAEDIFAATVEREKNKSEILDRTFREALDRAQKDTSGRPRSPLDDD